MKIHLQKTFRVYLCFFAFFMVQFGWGQQVIGKFPYMDGGFENQTIGALGTSLSTTNWSRQSQSGASSTISNTSSRSGTNLVTVTSVSTISRNLQSPNTLVASEGPLKNTSYVVQYFVRNSNSVANFQCGVTNNGTTNPTYSTAATLAANSDWFKYVRVLTTTNVTLNTSGIGIAGRAGTGSFDVDDFVIYQGTSVDDTAPNSPGTTTVSNATVSSLNVSWAAASAGVDDGGYVVVRYSSNPNIDNDPNQNGIYAVGNTISNGTANLVGTVRYIGTATTFTDNVGLTQGSQYWYKVYTVDKAFNYSSESQGSGSTAVTSTTWNGSGWSNGEPTSSLDAIIAENLTTTGNISCDELTINSGKTLTVSAGHSLTVAGDVVNNGSIVFKSNASGSGVFGVYTGAAITGSVTVERFIPANKRSFRFLTSAVTTSTSIKANWQENVSNTSTVYADNQNPNSGYGTHITGTGGSANGFDTTTTNNPSMYTYTNGAWAAVQNTNTNTFTAGTPYRLMVRGDRSIDMSTNTPTPTNTTLRATGALHTGDFSPALNQAASGYSFVGNPYQAPIDIKAALDASTNMNKTVVYYWDPTLNARGGYVTRDLSSNNNTPPTSDFNQYLQPGQAVFVKNTSAGAPTMTITESHKAVGNAAAGVFRTTDSSDFGLLRVNLQANTNNQWSTIEGTLAVFNNMYSWNTTEEDAVKFANLDEEVSLMQDNTSLAIAMQTNPSSTNELPIRLKNTRHTAYQWKFELSDYNGLTPYLLDTQNSTYTPIENNTVVPFTVNGQELNRFKIVFQNSALSIDDFANNIKLYPNPAKAGASFYIDGMAEATVSVYNVLGQNIPVQLKSQGNAIQVTPTQTLSQGIYLVTVTTEGKTQHVKWIVE